MISRTTRYQRTTIVFPHSEAGILLGFKKRGFGKGWWNGFGGKLEGGETYEESAKRETLEEVGIHIDNLVHIANLLFYFDDDLDVVSRAYKTVFKNDPVETEEMRPQFFPASKLPFDQMWAADRLWVPKALSPNVDRPLGFIVRFNKDKSFKTIEQVDAAVLEEWF